MQKREVEGRREDDIIVIEGKDLIRDMRELKHW